MNTQPRLARILLSVLFISTLFGAATNLSAQSGSRIASDEEEDNDTTISYVAPMLRMDKSAFVDMGAQGIQSVLTISNMGDGPLKIQEITWQKGSNYILASPPSLPLVIEPGGHQELSVLYTGTSPINDLPRDVLNVVSNNRNSMTVGLLIDLSRSMILDSIECNGTSLLRLDAAKARAREFLTDGLLYLPELEVQDEFMVMTYSDDPILTTNLTSVTATSRTNALNVIDQLQAIRGTQTGEGIAAAIEKLGEGTRSERTLIVLTDGETSDADKVTNPPDNLVQQAIAAGVTIYAVAVTDEPAAIEEYLNGITIPTGGLTFSTNDCVNLGVKLSRISEASHSTTIDYEPFPAGKTLSTPEYGESNVASAAITDITPNPGSDVVQVNLQTARATSAELMLYNSRGEQMGESITEELSAGGEHRISVDVRSFPAGTYIATVETSDGFRTSRKFIVVK